MQERKKMLPEENEKKRERNTANEGRYQKVKGGGEPTRQTAERTF